MKKLISVVLLLTFLFNVAGYYFGYLVLRYRARMELIQHLDKGEYPESEIITFRIPLTVPYYTDDDDYVRVDGAFENKGEFFKLVKQRLQRDTLYVVCIKDQKEKSLFTIMTDFAKLSTDTPGAQKTLNLMGSLIKEYVPALPIKSQTQEGWLLILDFVPQHFKLLEVALKIVSPPPDLHF